MYLSRVEIDLKNRVKTRNLNHLGAYHHWVEQSFPTEIESNVHSRKLWRIDDLNSKKYLLVVSKEKPDLEKLERFGVENSAQTKKYDVFIEKLENGLSARFRIVLNPVISISTGKKYGQRGRVVPHVTEKHKLDYFQKIAQKNGFKAEEEDVMIVKSSYEPLKKSNNKRINVSQVEYEGRLIITDIELFKNALTNGIGKKKAYGCGMLTIIPEP